MHDPDPLSSLSTAVALLPRTLGACGLFTEVTSSEFRSDRIFSHLTESAPNNGDPKLELNNQNEDKSDIEKEANGNGTKSIGGRRPDLGLKRGQFRLLPEKETSTGPVIDYSILEKITDPAEYFKTHDQLENAEKEIRRLNGEVTIEPNPMEYDCTRKYRPGGTLRPPRPFTCTLPDSLFESGSEKIESPQKEILSKTPIKEAPNPSKVCTIKEAPNPSEVCTIKEAPNPSEVRTIKEAPNPSEVCTIKEAPNPSKVCTIKEAPNPSKVCTIKEAKRPKACVTESSRLVDKLLSSFENIPDGDKSAEVAALWNWLDLKPTHASPLDFSKLPSFSLDMPFTCELSSVSPNNLGGRNALKFPSFCTDKPSPKNNASKGTVSRDPFKDYSNVKRQILRNDPSSHGDFIASPFPSTSRVDDLPVSPNEKISDEIVRELSFEDGVADEPEDEVDLDVSLSSPIAHMGNDEIENNNAFFEFPSNEKYPTSPQNVHAVEEVPQDEGTAKKDISKGSSRKRKSNSRSKSPSDNSEDLETPIADPIPNINTEIEAAQMEETPRETKKPKRAHPTTYKKRRPEKIIEGGTVWEAGRRKSTRVRTRPLRHWLGERLLYARVEDSLMTVVGVKAYTPTSRGPVLRVKSFSDKYIDLAEQVGKY